MWGIIETYLSVAVCIILGLFVFRVVMWLTLGNNDDKIKELESRHHNISQNETNHRLNLLYAARQVKDNPIEYEEIMRQYYELEKTHQVNRNKRVKEKNNLQVPYDEDAMREVEQGINPYRKKRR